MDPTRKAAMICGFTAFIIGAFMYYLILFKGRLVPAWLSVWGLIGAPLWLGATLLSMFRWIHLYSMTQTLLFIPIALRRSWPPCCSASWYGWQRSCQPPPLSQNPTPLSRSAGGHQGTTGEVGIHPFRCPVHCQKRSTSTNPNTYLPNLVTIVGQGSP